MARGPADDSDEPLYWLTFFVACFDEPDPTIWSGSEWIEATTWRGAEIARSPLASIEPWLGRPLVAVLQLAWRYIDNEPPPYGDDFLMPDCGVAYYGDDAGMYEIVEQL